MADIGLSLFVVIICFVLFSSYQTQTQNPRNQWNSPSESRNQPVTSIFKCSEMEKTCFRNNRILDPSSSKCYKSMDSKPCQGIQFFVASKKTFLNEKRIIGKCLSYCNKSGSSSDDECIKFDYVECPQDAFYKRNLFGDGFCSTEEKWNYTVTQPDTESECAVPNTEYVFKDPVFPDPWKGSRLDCSPQDVDCFRRNMLYSSSAGCVKPLEPCGNGERWLAQRETWEKQRRLQADCGGSCPQGDIFVADENRCASPWEVTNVLCASYVAYDIFGAAYCNEGWGNRLLNVSWIRGNGQCIVLAPLAPPVPTTFMSNAKPPCAEGDSGGCVQAGLSIEDKPQLRRK